MTGLEKHKIAGYLRLLRRCSGASPEVFDCIGRGYDVFASAWDEYFAAPGIDHLRDVAMQRAQSGAKVLDAGCGTGRRIELLRSLPKPPSKIVALDPSRAMLELARKNFSGSDTEFRTGDICDLPFETDTFDYVISTFVLDILENPQVAIEEMLRVLRPGGFVVYMHCCLPESGFGITLQKIESSIGEGNPPSPMAQKRDQHSDECGFSETKFFRNGLLAVSVVGKCCPAEDANLPSLNSSSALRR